MKRKFINQENSSNKFWSVEIRDKSQIITFGKVNTQGRQTLKKFDTLQECINDTEKLILQKEKKGYLEIIDSEVFPNKEELLLEQQEENFFWEIIKKSNKKQGAKWEKYDVGDHIDCLRELLSRKGKQKLVVFQKVLLKSLQRLYTAQIAEFSIILRNDYKNENGSIIFNDYISGDGFIYFRCWLILQGKEFFDDIGEDINTLISGKYSCNIGDIWAEGLLYVADEAYCLSNEEADESDISDFVDEQFPQIMHYDSMERVIDRPIKNGSELQFAYPELVEVIINIK